MVASSMELHRQRVSSLRVLTYVFAAVLVKCNAHTHTEALRIFQNRLSVVSGRTDIDIFEVIGLASVELDGGPITYFFDCNTTLNNGTGITWIYDRGAARFFEEPIPTSTNGKRFIPSGITENDLGVYTCLDTYTDTRVSINITRNNPAVLPVNRVLRVMEGTTATLQVYVSGYPLVTSNQIHWYRPNGTEVLEEEAVFEDGRRTVVLSEVQPTDSGMYRCDVTTSYGNHSTLIQLEVYGESPLRVYQGRIVIPVGSPLTVEVFPVHGLATVELVSGGPAYYLDCNTSRNDGSGISWRRVGGANRFSITNMSSTASKRLNLERISELDLGVYECFDSQSSDRAIVNITTDNPAVSAQRQTVDVAVGSQALLEVYVSGYPLLTSDHIDWYWPNGSIIQDQDASFMNDGRTLFLVDVQLSDAGVYLCEVTLPGSPGRTRSTGIQLDVFTNSFIISHPSPAITALERTTRSLSCSASGVPLPTITWEKEGGVIPLTATIVTTTPSASGAHNSVTSVLTFTDIRYSDRGRYRCVADNNKTDPIGSGYSQVTVTPRLLLFVNVSGEPRPLQDSFTLPDESDISLECSGSGDLQWTASNGQIIPVKDAESDGSDIYQVYVSSQDIQVLHIRNFSRISHAATYTCTSDLTIQGGAPVEIAVTLYGVEVTEVTTTEEERDPVNAAAIIGGILVVVLLIVMLVLFAVLIWGYFMKKRGKYVIPVSAEQPYENNGELSGSIASSLEKKPELSEESIHTETQFHNSEGSVHSETKLSGGGSIPIETKFSEGESAHIENKLTEIGSIHSETKLSEGESVHIETKLSESGSIHSETKLSEGESVHAERSIQQPGERATNIGTVHLSEVL